MVGVGERGDKGEKGERGLNGTQGMKGNMSSEVGDKGEKGLNGSIGDKGAKGGLGEKGEMGIFGRKGPPGPSGPNGGKHVCAYMLLFSVSANVMHCLMIQISIYATYEELMLSCDLNEAPPTSGCLAFVRSTRFIYVQLPGDDCVWQPWVR